MTTATCSPVVLLPAKFQPLWDALYNLGWSEIPSDLTEIDANWCYNKLSELREDGIDELLQLANWDVMNGFAWDLRDVCHDAKVEDREFLRECRDLRQYL